MWPNFHRSSHSWLLLGQESLSCVFEQALGLCASGHSLVRNVFLQNGYRTTLPVDPEARFSAGESLSARGS